MRMNPGIILSGQAPDIIGNMARGAQAAQFQNDAQHQNALRAMLQQNGAGIMAGEQNALAALAGFDPQAALGVQQTRQSMAESAERMQMARTQAARQAQAWAQGQSAEAVARERQTLANGLRGAAYFYSQGDQDGYNQFLTQQGIDPTQFSFDQFPAHAAMVEGVLDALAQFRPEGADFGSTPQGMVRLPDPTAPGGARLVRMAGLPEDTTGFRPASAEEAARYGAVAGQFGPDGRFYPVNPPSGIEIQTMPDGTTRVVQGPGAGGRSGSSFTEGQSRDVVYSTRARGALEALEPVAEALTSRGELMAEGVPLGLARGIQSPEFQTAMTAGTEFLQAILRKDTGAAITTQEREEYGRVYLPQPGDSPEVLQLRAQARRRALAALEAGMSADQIAVQTRALGAEIQQAAPSRQPAPPQPRVGPTPTGQPTQAQNVPDQAVRMLLDDPSPEAMREFDEVFGPGQARRLLEAMR